MNTIKYLKAPLTFEQQLELLTERGLIISDKKRARNFLSRINYYRLSAYCAPFEESKHQFKNNVHFSDIQNIYEFDKKLRNLIYEAVETIEIALRTSTAYYLVNKHNAFVHEDQTIFFNHKRFIFSEWKKKLHAEINRSQEKFIKHYKNKYKDFPVLPLWIAVEVMSLGSLSAMIFLLNKTDQKQIAKQYNLNYRVFCSWLHSLTYVRNICAHHGRLWDRRLSIKMMIPKQEGWKTVDPTNITSTIHMILYFFSKINLEKEQVNAWCNRYIELVSPPLSGLETHSKFLKLKQIQESSLWMKHTGS